MSEWDDYRFALALERSGSVRRAAAALGVNHATVSRRLAALNARLGAPAFERLEGRYRPTAVGEALVAAARRMEDAVFAAERQALGQEQGMSGPLSLSLPDVLAKHLLMADIGRFQAAYPEIRLTLQTSLDFADLDRREADLVVRVTNAPPDHLVGRRLFKYARCGYASPDYLSQTDPQELRWLGWPGDTDRPDWVRQSVFPDAPIGMRIEDPLVRHAAALAGQGMIFDACLLGDPEPGLVRLPGDRPEPDRDIWVLTHPDLKDAPKISAFMRHLCEAITRKRDLIEGRVS